MKPRIKSVQMFLVLVLLLSPLVSFGQTSKDNPVTPFDDGYFSGIVETKPTVFEGQNFQKINYTTNTAIDLSTLLPGFTSYDFIPVNKDKKTFNRQGSMFTLYTGPTNFVTFITTDHPGITFYFDDNQRKLVTIDDIKEGRGTSAYFEWVKTLPQYKNQSNTTPPTTASTTGGGVGGEKPGGNAKTVDATTVDGKPASPKGAEAKPLPENAYSARWSDPLGANGIVDIKSGLSKVMSFVLLIAIPFITLALMYSGFLFVKSFGNAGELTKAKTTLLWTLAGAALLLGATTIGNAIINTFQKIGKKSDSAQVSTQNQQNPTTSTTTTTKK